MKVVLEEREKELGSLREELTAGLSRKGQMEQSETRELKEAKERIVLLD